jgi:O-antigen/teichoic acid export membrane protein
MTKMIAFISLPLGVNLVILSKPISLVIFGQKWSGIEVVIAILGIKEAISWLVGLNPEIYRAVGRPDINTKLLISAVIYYLPIYFLAAPYGLLVFCIFRLAVAIVSMGLHIFVANRILGLKFTYLGGCIKEPLFGSLVIVIVLYLISYFIGEIRSIEGLFKIFGTVSIGATVYIASLWLLRKELVLRFWELVKEEIISVFPNFSKEI